MEQIEQIEKLTELRKKRVNRRNFLAGVGAAGAATVLAGCSSDQVIPASPTPTPNPNRSSDADLLNFALNLEYLEAEYYLYAATGSGLSAADTSGTGAAGATTTGGSSLMVPGLTTKQQAIVNEIAYDEQQHVRFLRSALGSAAVAKPAIDLTFFAPLAVAAGIPGGAGFSPFVSFDAFLLGAFVFEDVGVTAYHGAAPLITPAGVAAGYLGAAAGILAVEAYHAAYIRTTITGMAIQAETTGTGGFQFATIANANLVAMLRSILSGGSSTNLVDETLLTLPNSNIAAPAAVTSPVYSSTIVAADSNAVAFSRTVNQVHHIVYGSATVGVSSGGFFPNGTNSIFSVTTA